MRKCNCLSPTVIEAAKQCLAKANGDMAVFLELLNQSHIGGGQLHFGENGSIIGIYSECYCDIPKVTKDIPACYCECSAGWFENLFTSTLNKQVTVKIIHTIVGGNENCVFEILV